MYPHFAIISRACLHRYAARPNDTRTQVLQRRCNSDLWQTIAGCEAMDLGCDPCWIWTRNRPHNVSDDSSTDTHWISCCRVMDLLLSSYWLLWSTLRSSNNIVWFQGYRSIKRVEWWNHSFQNSTHSCLWGIWVCCVCMLHVCGVCWLCLVHVCV